MLLSIVAAQISLVEYDAPSCVVVIATNFPGLVSYKSGIKSSSFSPLPLPIIDFEPIVELFNSCTAQHLRFTTPPNWQSPSNLPFLLVHFYYR